MRRGIILKNRFIHIFCFNTLVLVRIHGSPDGSREKIEKIREKIEKNQEVLFFLLSGRFESFQTSVISVISVINSNPSWMILLLREARAIVVNARGKRDGYLTIIHRDFQVFPQRTTGPVFELFEGIVTSSSIV